MKPHRIRYADFWIKGWQRRAAILVGIASCCGSAMAAEPGIEITVVTPSTVQRPPPEIAPGGAVVLRGSQQTDLNVGQPAPAGKRYGSTNSPPAGALLPLRGNYDTTGFDRNYDTTGFDRNYDTTGIDRRYDRNYDTTSFDRNYDTTGFDRNFDTR
jgi:hypothetical protein